MMPSRDITKKTAFIKSTAQKLNFDYCGISKAEFLAEDAERLKKWLDNEYHGQMSYMINHFDKRVDPRALVDDARSVISLLYNYFPETELPEKDNYKISRYAYGEDYHFVIKNKLKKFLGIIREELPEAEGRVFVDSAPVLERQWAARSGLGWIGKNTMLINKEAGSFLFIAEIILNIELTYDNPIGDFCGTCTKCIDACPTNALIPYEMDASKCISYLTIELKEDIPEEFNGKLKDWIFGCDICQEVCPWNRFSGAHNEPLFQPKDKLKSMNKKDWIEMSKPDFQKLFRKSAVLRAKYDGIKRNINLNNS
jgi:epoxyqueuosine reductase